MVCGDRVNGGGEWEYISRVYLYVCTVTTAPCSGWEEKSRQSFNHSVEREEKGSS